MSSYLVIGFPELTMEPMEMIVTQNAINLKIGLIFGLKCFYI